MQPWTIRVFWSITVTLCPMESFALRLAVSSSCPGYAVVIRVTPTNIYYGWIFPMSIIASFPWNRAVLQGCFQLQDFRWNSMSGCVQCSCRNLSIESNAASRLGLVLKLSMKTSYPWNMNGCTSCITTSQDKPFEEIGWHCCAAQYKSNVYPVGSDSTQYLNPHFVGLLRIYWRKCDLAFDLTIHSSIDRWAKGWYSSKHFSFMWRINWL